MEILAVLLMLGSALGVAGRDVARRWLLREKVLSVSNFLVATQALTVMFLFCVDFLLVAFGIPFRRSQNLFWIALLGTVVVNLWIQYAGAKSSELGEASLVGPVQSLTPGLVTIPALLLGEWPSQQGWIGIVIIMMGNFVHARAGEPVREWWKIFALLRLPKEYQLMGQDEQEKAYKNTRALRWAYGSAVGGAVGLIFDGLMVRSGDMMLGITWKWALVTLCFFWKGSVRKRRDVSSERGVFHYSPAAWGIMIMLLCGLCLALGDGLAAATFRLAPIAYVGSLKRLSIVLGVLLSWVFLREEKAKIRLLPATLVTGGAALLSLDGIASVVIDRIEQSLQ